MATPTLTELQNSCARDLRDPNQRTFTDPILTDLINAGQEELSRVYPREMIASGPIIAGTTSYTMEITQAFRVEVWRNNVFRSIVPSGEDADNSQAGYDIFAGALRFPKALIDSLSPTTDTFKVWGYATYPQLVLGADESMLDDAGEWGVRRYVRSQAFQQMHADRAQFKQWQGQAQNSDVTPNMLNQMVSFYTSEWDRTRNHLRRLRRQ
jgi:hypothetical protein